MTLQSLVQDDQEIEFVRLLPPHAPHGARSYPRAWQARQALGVRSQGAFARTYPAPAH